MTNVLALSHQVRWVTAAPLWKTATRTPAVMQRSEILGFGSDTFMEDLLGELERAPDGIASHVATGPSRSYRARQPGEAYGLEPRTALSTLKLYQPAHGWFYLVAGSLVCQIPGLPDHRLDLGAGDRAGFVIRRVGANSGELAMVVDAGGRKSWRAVPAGGGLVTGEEVLPLFPLGFQEGDRRRKLMAGVIPVGAEDALQAAPVGEVANTETKPPPADALEDVKARVTGAIALLHAASPPAPAAIATETSRFILLDLADFLGGYVPAVLAAIDGGAAPATLAAAALYTFLLSHTVDGQSYVALVEAARSTPASDFGYNLAHANTAVLGTFEDRLQAALEEATSVTIEDVPVETQRASQTSYVTRLVYQRPQCGRLHADVISPPSERFVLAPFFDPDAPARPIRIALPFDPSPTGLRQFRKNVKLVLSDALRKKVAGIGPVKGDLEGPGFDCGGLSFSIPIITICAMIILFIFLNLLNIVFWWLPFVKICFPKIKVEL